MRSGRSRSAIASASSPARASAPWSTWPEPPAIWTPRAGHARRLAAMEPFDLDVQRDFIEICMRRGRRSEAMRRYAIVRKRVKREFGQDPDFTLGDLRG